MRLMNTLRAGMLTAVAIAASLLPLSVSASAITGTIIGTRAGAQVNLQILNSADYVNPTKLWGGQIEFTPIGGDFSGTLLPDTSANVIAFCLEPQEHIGYSTYTWQVSPLEQAGTGLGGIGITRSQQIQDLLYHVRPAFGVGLLTNTEALALQISLWEIVSEIDTGPYALNSGNARFTDPGSLTTRNALTLAQGWLDSYVNDGVAGPYQNDLLALTRVGNQDLLVQQFPPPSNQLHGIPSPATLLLFAPAVLLMRRRSHACQ
jgi:hypothetical protein